MNSKRYSKDHIWLQLEDNRLVKVGISEFAQNELGDVVYIEFPEVGTVVSSGDEVAVVESVKTANDIRVPVSGEVVSVNMELNETPERLNQISESEAWLFELRLSDERELHELMSEDEYIDWNS
ncbi:MAG: glycine cleavage system protein GcvH [Candidatus Eutrophobiaceae bacterium]